MGTNYYVRTPACANACDHCAESTQIHLGKASSGWRFLHKARDGWTPETAGESWLLLAASGPITDEYGHDHTLFELLQLIAAKRGGRSHLEPQSDLGYRGPTPHDMYISDGREFSTGHWS